MHKFALVIVALSVAPLLAQATEPPSLKGTKKTSAPPLKLDLPAFENIPQNQKLESAAEAKERSQSPAPSVDESYSIVRLIHGRGFVHSADGLKPTLTLAQIAASGSPLMLDGFSSVVRVKHERKKDARIELVVLDDRGDTVMSAEGALRFGKSQQAEWQVDWEPTRIRAAGDYQVLIRIGGNPISTLPLKIVSE